MILIYRLLASIILISTYASCCPALVYASDRVGVIDLNGEYVISPVYQCITYLGHGIYSCEKPGGLLLDGNGRVKSDNIVILDSNGHASSMREVANRTRLENEKRRKAALERQLGSGQNDYSEGLCVFSQESKRPEDKHGFTWHVSNRPNTPAEAIPITIDHPIRYGYKDEKGNIVVPAQFFEAGRFSEGLAAVRLNSTPQVARYCYIDVNGMKISPDYWRASIFRDGFACVAINDDSAIPYPGTYLGTGRFGRYGLIDKKFDFVIPPKYAEMVQLGQNAYFAVPIANAVSRIVDSRDKLITELPARYTSAHLLSDGLWLLKHPNPENATASQAISVDCDGRIVDKIPENMRLIEGNAAEYVGVEGHNGETYRPSDSGTLVFKRKDGTVKKVEFTAAKCDYGVYKDGLAAVEVFARSESNCPFRHLQQGVLDLRGNWVLEPQNCDFEVAEKDRIIKRIYQEHFDVEERRKTGAWQLPFLLWDYDLIGMNKDRLQTLIGHGSERADGLWFSPSSGGQCGFGRVSLQFHFEKNCVKRWRIVKQGNPQDNWIETNVIGNSYEQRYFRPKYQGTGDSVKEPTALHTK